MTDLKLNSNTNIIKHSDDSHSFEFLALNADQQTVNLSGYKLEARFGLQHGENVDYQFSVPIQANDKGNPIITISSAIARNLYPNEYLLEVWATKNGATSIYPSADYAKLTVSREIAGYATSDISPMTFDEAVDKVKTDLTADYTTSKAELETSLKEELHAPEFKGDPSDVTLAGDNKFIGTNSFEKPITMQSKTVATTADVNTKQDKIGYTPADDSKVVHNSDMRKPAGDVVGLEDITQTALPDGTDFYKFLNTAGRPLQYFVATFTHAQTMINKPASKLSAFMLITSAVNNSTNTAYNYTFLNLRDVSAGDSYEALINTDGTGKITVARPWHKLADDSKVVHLSGDNNFDTVPTVKNNPLLLQADLSSYITLDQLTAILADYQKK